MLHEQLSRRVLGVFYKVYNTLGHGFLEKVYENALMVELNIQGLPALQQQKIGVYYDGRKVGQYYADILVDRSIILEIKAADAIAPEHEAQLINYLKATDVELGFVLNFGAQPQFARRILTNDFKQKHNYP